ncbi:MULTISPECIES: cysteine hydrolase family protein [Sphingobium]|uniref:Cysteine hydrolase family protein n=1 Tax=Sphingobium tyrosinilyticum TaxID=2715436 RepID=A0ABV9EXF4_9SPHN|nr:cysteine hydrolase [Sphingobium sp. EP60837]ANI79662.1 Peroxyureidoacrylate/ureidoacrylate amidohydrolase [Sphingobium sp. EP60837]
MAVPLHGRAALIISECQRGIVEQGMGGFAGLIGQVAERGILLKIAHLAGRFRDAGLPIWHLTIAHRPDFADVQPNSLLAVMARKNRLLIAGSPEAQIVGELSPAPQDFVVARSSGLIGLHGTALDAMLRRMRIDTIVITGVSTNVAVAGCAMAGADLGYHVIIAEDCVAAADSGTHEVIMRDQLRMVARIASADDIEQALQPSGPY